MKLEIKTLLFTFEAAGRLAHDRLNHLYLVGGFTGIVDFDPNPQSEFFVSAIGSNGNLFISKLSESKLTINPNDHKLLSVMPNPTKGMVILDFGNIINANYKVSIIDISG